MKLPVYGSGPAHAVTIALGGLVGIYAAVKLFEPDPLGILVWFVLGAAAHDLVLVPAYTALDRAARRSLPSGTHGAPGVPFWYDHIRVPVLLAGLLGLVFLPLMARIPPNFEGITGTGVEVYLGRYLATVAAMFTISALALVLRMALRRRRSTRSG